MSDALTLARPYAKAAFLFASKHGSQNPWLQTLSLLAEAAQDRLFAKALMAPDKRDSERLLLLEKVIGEGSKIQGMTHFLTLLARNKRLDLLAYISDHFHRYVDASEGVMRATVTSAQSVDKKELAQISQMLQKRFNARDVVLTNVVDSALIEGYRISSDTGWVIDVSYAEALRKLSAAFGI